MVTGAAEAILPGRWSHLNLTIPGGARCHEPSLPTGDGEAKSHTGPLQESSLAFPPQLYPTAPRLIRLPSLRLVTGQGTGEHPSLLEPVGGLHAGPTGPRRR